MKCRKFTLNFQEILETTVRKLVINLENRPVHTMSRKSTRDQSLKHVDKLVNVATKKNIGFIKLYTYDLAIRDNWTELDFGIEKGILRSRYSVTRNKSHFTAKFDNEKMLLYLKKNAYQKNHNVVST